MFKIGDKVKIKWTDKRVAEEDFFGIGKTTARRLEKITGNIKKVEFDYYAIVFSDGFCWAIPDDSLVLISGDAPIISSSVPGNFCGCKVAMKKQVKFTTFQYDYCSGCKKEIR